MVLAAGAILLASFVTFEGTVQELAGPFGRITLSVGKPQQGAGTSSREWWVRTQSGVTTPKRGEWRISAGKKSRDGRFDSFAGRNLAPEHREALVWFPVSTLARSRDSEVVVRVENLVRHEIAIPRQTFRIVRESKASRYVVQLEEERVVELPGGFKIAFPKQGVSTSHVPLGELGMETLLFVYRIVQVRPGNLMGFWVSAPFRYSKIKPIMASARV